MVLEPLDNEHEIGANDPLMKGLEGVCENPMDAFGDDPATLAAQMTDGTPVEKRGTMRRPVLAVGIWANIDSVKFREPVLLSNGKQLSSANKRNNPELSIHLLTNRMIKIRDFKGKAHVYCPCENVIYFTLEDDVSAHKRTKD